MASFDFVRLRLTTLRRNGLGTPSPLVLLMSLSSDLIELVRHLLPAIHLRVSTPVRHVVVENGGVTSVIIDDGPIEAAAVICAISATVENLFLAGDYMRVPSVNGALASGVDAANEVAELLASRPA